jgi:outer membrane protein assembly factor BamB
VLWEVQDAFTLRTVASPVIAEEAGLVIATAGEGRDNRQLVAVRPPKAPGEKPEVAYKLTRIPPYVPTPLVKGDLTFLWGDLGTVTCVQTATGKTVWTDKVGGDYYGSPVLTGNTIWCMSRKGDLVGIAAGEEYKPVGKLNLGEPTHATPAVAGGKMYLRTVSHLICVGKK